MIESGDGLGLSLKTCATLLVPGKLRREDFECDAALELLILGQVNVAHSTGADLLHDRVVREPVARLK